MGWIAGKVVVTIKTGGFCDTTQMCRILEELLKNNKIKGEVTMQLTGEK